MPKLLIIYSHWYPSNLAGVHRARLTGNYLHQFGWKPIILTVKPEFYEEKPDPDMYRLFSDTFIEYRVDALKISKIRLIGDVGLRAFFQLYRKAKEIIRTEKPDFLWIPIPSFYTALLGRMLNSSTGIKYGIDYIDPWVRDISKDGSLRARLSIWVAKILEPIAVKKASLITGVAYEYYKPVLERNFKDVEELKSSKVQSLKEFFSNHQVNHCAFPYGFDPNDHSIEILDLKLPWADRPGCIPIVYAGAFMPNSGYFIDTFFKAFSQLESDNKIDKNIHLYFLGTGNYPHKSLTKYALENGICQRVTEIHNRFPFLHILNILAKAEKLLIIGSTEKHYTASKTYQVILSKRPFLGMFHHESTALDVLRETNTDKYAIAFNPKAEKLIFYEKTFDALNNFLNTNNEWNPNYNGLGKYSAKEGAKLLTETIEKILSK